MARSDLVAGDGGSVLSLTVLDSATGQPVNLTAKTVQLRYSFNGGSMVERVMTVANQTASPGVASYQFAPSDFTVAGTVVGEVRLQQALADQLTSVDRFQLTVKAPLPTP